jgi:PIN domain nuclease of toxin-antitoxin system
MDRVLDASALLAVLHDEPGAERVELERSAISTVNWSEVLSKCRDRGVETEGLREDLEALGLSIEPFTLKDAELAAEIRPRVRPLGLSFGDRACLALGLRLGLPVVTADRAWKGLQLGLEIHVIR